MSDRPPHAPRHDADLERIAGALEAAADILAGFVTRGFEVDRKRGGDPVTEADLAVDLVLRERLPAPGDGWLSEETVDDARRLDGTRVWIVDPLDGTKEFVQGIPEWCCSVGLVVDGTPVAGGIVNPATGQTILGALGHGVTCNGDAAVPSDRASLDGARVLASRSELKRGEWDRFDDAAIDVVPTGSVAYKMALVAAGLADATWTLVPKSEWDVAAGVALVRAAGGEVWQPDGASPAFNQRKPLLPGLIAAPSTLAPAVRTLLAR